MNLLSIVAICFCGVIAAPLVALVYALNRPATVAPPVFVITHVPRSIGLPTAWRRTHESEHWN
jgi:hypothetical protein